MYMLRQKIVKSVALDDDTTWRYKLPSLGKFTALEMQIEAGRYGTRTLNTVCHPIESCISKIELLAGGSKALLALTGQQLDAANYWAFKRPTPRRYRQGAASNDNVINLYLLGGRSLYDTKYGWDFSKLPETYLEYTYDLQEDVADYFAAGTHYVTLYGWRWMGPGDPSFIGYFRARQLAAWATTGADVLKNIELPVGNPYRWIGVQAKTRGQSIGGTFTNIELKVNNGEYSPVDIPSAMDWCQQEAVDYGMQNTVSGVESLVSTSQTDLPYWWSYYDNVLASIYGDVTAGELFTHFLTLPARLRETTTGGGEVSFTSRGNAFQKCLRIGFDHFEDGFDLLRTAGMGALDLVLTEQADAENAAVFAQDIVSY